MHMVSDRELAASFGYPPNAGGYKAAREFMARRGVSPIDDRRPAMYNLVEVERAVRARPAARGNFARGAEREQQTRKAQATKRRKAAQQEDV